MSLTRRCKTAILVSAIVVIGIAAVAILVYNLNRKICDNKNEVYHKETRKCYPRDLRGPCKPTMVLIADRYKRHGICGCPFKDHPRPLLYHRDTDHCYFVFSQAFCSDGFWLNATKKGEPFCEPNRCLGDFENSKAAADEIVPIKGDKCAILNQPADGCEKDEVVKFHHNYILPSCKSPPPNFISAISVPISDCPPGTHLNLVGMCTPDFEFDF